MQCYANSDTIAGQKTSTALGDRSDLSANINTINANWRSAAIMSCETIADGTLVGHKIAIADYSTLTGSEKPTNLLWLTGLGITTESSTVKCYTYTIPHGVGLKTWTVYADTNGINYSTIYFSSGVTYTYGKATTLTQTATTFTFSPSEPLVGLYGYQDSNLHMNALGVITYASSYCS